jgi:hypothetical protein
MSEWISVKERLPDKNGRYLICTKYTSKRIELTLFEDGEWAYYKVSHWMALPEAPK